MKVPQGNYAMVNSHFNKLDSHILLIMVNLIIPFKPCLHTQKSLSFSSYMFFPVCVSLSTDQKCTICYFKCFRGEILKANLVSHNYKSKIRERTINLTQNIFK